MEKISVDLGDRTYPIYFGEFIDFGRYLKEVFADQIKSQNHLNLIVVSNDVVGALYGDAIQKNLKSEPCFKVSYCEILDGEHEKNLKTYGDLVEKLLELKIDRKSVVVALGGGVTTDIVGFAAATVLRGVSFVNIPSSLLAMVDASVGGKTGVNSTKGKNLIGAFWQPSMVYVALDLLKTLPDPELRCGLGEVVKHAVLDKDFYGEISFLDWLIKNGDSIANKKENYLDLLKLAVKRSCEVKSKVVASDERESGARALLNLGHTVAHSIELVQGIESKTGEENKLRHGEAVGIGTIGETFLSMKRGVCKDDQLLEKIKKALVACGLPTSIKGVKMEELIEATFMDKKREDTKISVTLPVAEGDVILEKITPSELEEAFAFVIN